MNEGFEITVFLEHSLTYSFLICASNVLHHMEMQNGQINAWDSQCKCKRNRAANLIISNASRSARFSACLLGLVFSLQKKAEFVLLSSKD